MPVSPPETPAKSLVDRLLPALFWDVDGVKVDCVRYPYAWLTGSIVGDGFRLADIRDIAPMKLAAVETVA